MTGAFSAAGRRRRLGGFKDLSMAAQRGAAAAAKVMQETRLILITAAQPDNFLFHRIIIIAGA